MMQTRTSGKENQMTEQERKAMMGEDEDVRGAQRSRGRWLIAFKFKCKGRHARLITPLSWWDENIMWEFPSCRCWTWYWMNKLAVSLVNKACWPKFPVGAFHCVVCGAFFFFLKLCLAETHDTPCYFIEEAQECTQECPSECLLTRMIMALRCWQRRFVGVHAVHSPGDTRVAVRLSRRISRHFRIWM